jgi:pyruvate,orthophosphate dikinase
VATKYVYSFGAGKADGKSEMKNLLGGKGANLAEMANLGMPVPPGFTLTTDVCTCYYANGRKYPRELEAQVEKALTRIEKEMGSKFGDADNPLLVSCRSGARQSMPGMMETVLNIGLTSATIPGLVAKTGGNERFVYDAYRRLITMYSDVVMEKAAGIEPEGDTGIRKQLEELLEEEKEKFGCKRDIDLPVEALKELCEAYKAKVNQVLGKPFPDDAMDQLWGGIGAVFQSWNGKRAVAYRNIEGIPHEWGTATNVQTMVFGNMGDNSATGVAFTRNPATGENKFYGEWLVNAQGEDVVAGTRTPNPLNESTRPEGNTLPSLEKAMPSLYKQLVKIRNKLEDHYRDMQDIEFTIQEGRLWMLQTRTGKRNGIAAVKMAVDMVKQRMIDADTAILRVKPEQLDELLHPILDPKEEKKAKPLGKGLPAGPGGAVGQIVFSADDAVAWARKYEAHNERHKDEINEQKQVILVREETNPEDIEGMRAAIGILTARGGMTSHAALVARGWGKSCIVGADAISIKDKSMTVGGVTLKEGDVISLNGSKGLFYQSGLTLVDPTTPELTKLREGFLKFCDKVRRLKVRTNADTPSDASTAVEFGAQGIGLFRIEHMFYGEGSEEPLFHLRKLILSLSKSDAERQQAINELFPFVKKDVLSTLDVMKGKPVTFRLLDPPLHEFVPVKPENRSELAKALNIDAKEIADLADKLHETNPMMGHRGVRLGVSYPEVAEMQIRAILEAAAELTKARKKVLPEIMIPVTCSENELERMQAIVDRVAAETKQKFGLRRLNFLFGTMIEIPRACLIADKMAGPAQFFSFGTNDLTQMGFGFSRDDIGGFVKDYIDKPSADESAILPADPFNVLDQDGVGQLVQMGVERGRSTRPDLKVGICGEHGGEAESVKFCHRVGMDYVSCSPFRVPIARLAAAQAVLEETGGSPAKPSKPSKSKKKTARKR